MQFVGVGAPTGPGPEVIAPSGTAWAGGGSYLIVSIRYGIGLDGQWNDDGEKHGAGLMLPRSGALVSFRVPLSQIGRRFPVSERLLGVA